MKQDENTGLRRDVARPRVRVWRDSMTRLLTIKMGSKEEEEDKMQLLKEEEWE